MRTLLRLVDDLRDRERLLFGQPDDDEHERFFDQMTDGRRLPPRPPVRLLTRLEGQLRDISFTTLGTPVVSDRAAKMLARVAPDDVQFFPAEVDLAGVALFVLNITKRVDCLDEKQSTFTGYRGPGQFVCVNELVLDPTRLGDAKLFRVAHSEMDLIVTDEVRQAILADGLTGGWFRPVATSGGSDGEVG